MNNSIQLKKKICLLGSVGVGKTSLIRRFVYDIFEDSYISTIGVKITQKIMPALKNSSGDIVQFNFLIWDIEGFEQSAQYTDNYLIGATAAILVGDLTRVETVQNYEKLYNHFLSLNPKAKVVTVANKSDLKVNQKAERFFEDFIKRFNMKEFKTSAKSGKNVNEAFIELAQLLLD